MELCIDGDYMCLDLSPPKPPTAKQVAGLAEQIENHVLDGSCPRVGPRVGLETILCGSGD